MIHVKVMPPPPLLSVEYESDGPPPNPIHSVSNVKVAKHPHYLVLQLCCMRLGESRDFDHAVRAYTIALLGNHQFMMDDMFSRMISNKPKLLDIFEHVHFEIKKHSQCSTYI